MSEYYNNDENYEEELIYRDKSTFEKIFSFRTVKTIIKAILYFLVILVYGLLFFRLCTGNPPKELRKILWTADAYAAYEEYGDSLKVYSHEPVENIAEDSVSGIYNVVYIPASGTMQMTVRYNKSIVDDYYEKALEKRTEEIEDAVIKSAGYDRTQLATLPAEEKEVFHALIEERLAKSLEEDPIKVSESEFPFVFVLRDNYGNVYAKYSYTSDTKTVYHYQRLSFEDVYLFGTGQSTPDHEYPSPDVENPSYIYKGENAGSGKEITYLYLDMYYDIDIDLQGETYSYPIQVYVSSVELKPYDFSKETPTAITEGLSEMLVENTAN